jgi:hypothetical protein
MTEPAIADLILTNGRFHTLDRSRPEADTVAIAGGRFLAVGDTDGSHAPPHARQPARRPWRPHRHSGTERLAFAPDPRRPELQPGAALGRRAVP